MQPGGRLGLVGGLAERTAGGRVEAGAHSEHGGVEEVKLEEVGNLQRKERLKRNAEEKRSKHSAAGNGRSPAGGKSGRAVRAHGAAGALVNTTAGPRKFPPLLLVPVVPSGFKRHQGRPRT